MITAWSRDVGMWKTIDEMNFILQIAVKMDHFSRLLKRGTFYFKLRQIVFSKILII